MIALTKRNLLLYFRNRPGVFFSLLAAMISFLLYIVFLKKLYCLSKKVTDK